jgi:hypothetical protein
MISYESADLIAELTRQGHAHGTMSHPIFFTCSSVIDVSSRLLLEPPMAAALSNRDVF